MMLLVLVLNACGPVRQMQKVESPLPMIGSVGKQRSKLFKKDFQKVGEPILASAIAVSARSVPFTSSMLGKYIKYCENQGLQPLVIEKDTAKTSKQRYFELTVTDVIGLAEALNSADNKVLLKYLQEDTDLVLLSQISFMTDIQTAQRIESADHLFLVTDLNGVLVLQVGDAQKGHGVKMSILEAFDFETAGFCWKKNKRGKLQIAHILMDGVTCPGDTEANPKKLDKTPDYLKL